MTCLDASGFFIAEVDGCSAVTTRKRVLGYGFLKNTLVPFFGEQGLTIRGMMINYITRVRVGCRAVFTFGLTTVSSAEGVVVVGHRWRGGMRWDGNLDIVL